MSLVGYLLRRGARGLLVVGAITVLSFWLVRAFADPVRIMLPLSATQADIDRLRHALGLDRPALLQFLSFLGKAIRGDFGVSYWQNTDAMHLAISKLPASFVLASGALTLAIVFGLPLGLIGGARPGSFADRLTTAAASLGVAVPSFWLAIMLIIAFSVTLRWFPTSGYGTPSHAVLPILALSLRPMGMVARLVREATRGEISKQYVSTARAKGLSESAIVRRHVVKNVAPLVSTLVSFEFLFVFTGTATAVETVFNWPGLGRLAVNAAQQGDLTLMSAIVVLTAALAAIISMISDLIVGCLDPRTRQ
jgi:peptide/nickel transport system permease protein